jgi:hypothetical protein
VNGCECCLPEPAVVIKASFVTASFVIALSCFLSVL